MANNAADIEKLDIGKVIQTTVSLVVRNRASLFIVSLVFSAVPSTINYIVYSENISQNYMPKNISITISVWIVYILFYTMSHASSAFIVKFDIENRSNQLILSIENSFQNIFPVFIVNLLSTLAYIFGLILLVVPGIMIGCALSVNIPAQLFEKTTILMSFKRSRDLTRGNRWPIFGLVLIFFALYYAMMFLFSVPFGGLTAFANVKSLGTQIRLLMLSVFSGMFLGPGLAVLYFELRRINTGAASTDMGQVFD